MEKYHSDDIHSDINFMIDAAYELEGLLLLAKSRGENVDDEVLELIKQKINALQFSIEGITSTTSEPEEESAPAVETEDFEEDDTAEPDFELQYVLEDDEVIDSTEDDEEDAEEVELESEEEEEEEEEPEAEEAPVEEYVTEEPIIEESEEIEVQEEEPEEETEEEPEDEPVAEPAAEEEESEESEESEDVDDTTDEETVDAPITLDQAYIINKSKDLSTAFSLNDTYRFRRELFGNSAADMTDAINLANAMASYEEAEDYFYEDLGWDKDSEEVQDFMAIIKNHFIV